MCVRDLPCTSYLNVKSGIIKPLAVGLIDWKLLSPTHVTFLDPNKITCLVTKRGDLFKGFKGLLLHKTFIQRPGQCKMKTMDCRLRTGGKMQTADHV